MANQAQIDRIRKACEAILSKPLESLIEDRERWGPLNFKEARPFIDAIQTIARQLLSLPLQHVIENHAENIADHVEAARTAIQQVAEFETTKGNPNDRIPSITQTLKSASDNLVVATMQWIPFLAYLQGDVARNIEAMKSTASAMRELLGSEETNANKRREEIDGLVRATREAAAKAGVAVFTQDFADESTRHRQQAKNWLVATGGFAVATVVAAIVFMALSLPETASHAYVVQFMTSKLVIVVVLGTATIWCGRLFKASMHMAASNSHRANALKTFQAFIGAAGSDDTTRNAVLLETTRSIFAITPSGYLETAEPAIESGTKVLEIFRDGKGA